MLQHGKIGQIKVSLHHPGKGKCGSFRSPWSCPCGQPAYLHQMVIENKEERLARGHPVGQDVPYAAMGGLTGFS